MSRFFSSADQELYSVLQRVMRQKPVKPVVTEQEFEGVSAVEYNDLRTRVVTISARPGFCESIGVASLYTRTNVIRSIQAGFNFIMLREDGNGGWLKGLHISVAIINGVEYLKTGIDRDEADRIEFGPASN